MPDLGCYGDYYGFDLQYLPKGTMKLEQNTGGKLFTIVLAMTVRNN